MLDGVYRRTDGEPVFVEVLATTDDALQALRHKIIGRMMKLLTRRCASGGDRACKRERGPEGRAPPRTPARERQVAQAA